MNFNILFAVYVSIVTCVQNILASDTRTGEYVLNQDTEIQLEPLFDIFSGSIFTCGSLCLSESACDAYAFDPVTNKCISFSGNIGNTMVYLTQTTQYYRRKWEYPKDCKALYDSGFKTDGVYRIYPDFQTSFEAYCDMSSGGWTVIQRRKYGDVSFDRLWVAYAEGFGEIEGDHWLGLRHLHKLTENHPSRIHFRFLMTKTAAYATALYDGFYIDDEAAEFRMHVEPKATFNSEMEKYVDYHGFFYYHNNMKFTTKDQDNDISGSNCAANSMGPFWYNNCWMLRPNAKFSEIGIYSTNTTSSISFASRTEIKIKRM